MMVKCAEAKKTAKYIVKFIMETEPNIICQLVGLPTVEMQVELPAHRHRPTLSIFASEVALLLECDWFFERITNGGSLKSV